MNELNLPLTGIIPPLVTPLAGNRLDIAGLDRLIEHVLSGRVHGLFILGTSGEGPSLSESLKRDLIERTLNTVAERVPVVVGISDTSLDDSAALGQFAAEHGAAAVAATAPFYFPLEQAAIGAWFERLAGELPLPLLLYNFPMLTKVVIEPDTVEALMDNPGIVGIKDSSGDLEYFARLCELARRRSDWSVFMGPEGKLVEAVQLGAGGGICGGANVYPRLFVELFDAARRRDTACIAELRNAVASVAEELYGEPLTCESVIVGLKRALSSRRICSPDTSLPLAPDQVRHVPVQISGRDEAAPAPTQASRR